VSIFSGLNSLTVENFDLFLHDIRAIENYIKTIFLIISQRNFLIEYLWRGNFHQV